MVSEKILKDIANILRRDSLISTTKAGSGHPTSCLSSAEIISALFFNEMSYDVRSPKNPDNDEFILSKGHAAPIIYSALYRAGCIKNDLTKLRKLNSPLEGHPVPRSLPWIKVGTGSLGQGLSAGAGMALAAKLQKRKYRTYVLLGDSEMAEGSVYEAMQFASFYNLNNLTAIIDVNRLGQRGETMVGHNLSVYKRRFESFGWNAEAIDGHNMREILSALRKVRKSNKPSVIIAKTFKGKGVSFLEDKEGWHGKALSEEELDKALKEIPNPGMLKIKIPKPKVMRLSDKKEAFREKEYGLGDLIATRDAYGDALASLAKSDSKVVAIDAEVSNSTKSAKVKVSSPSQFVEAYIAEQNMIGVATGLSAKGFKVFASSFAAFLSRAHDQIRMSALSSLDLTVAGSHAGVSIGEDGASQMGLEDIAMFRDLPDSKVFYPSDAVSCQKIVSECKNLKGIKYIRTTRGKTPLIYSKGESFKSGDFKILKQSNKDKAVILGAGITLHESLKAYESLKNKINTAVIDLYCIKPFNSKKFIEFVKKHGNNLLVVEDHYKAGGIGEMLSSALSGTGIKVKHLHIKGIPHSGKPEELLSKHKIDSKAIEKAVKEF